MARIEVTDSRRSGNPQAPRGSGACRCSSGDPDPTFLCTLPAQAGSIGSGAAHRAAHGS